MRSALAILLAMTCGAHAQQVSVPAKIYTFTATADETNMVFNKLGELPWKEVNPLIQKWIAQLNAQNAPPAPSPEAAPPTAPKE